MELTEMIPEREHDEKAIYNLSTSDRHIIRNGNFTTVIFTSDDGVVAGTAKRNPNEDPDLPDRAERIATVRAYRYLRTHGWG